MKRILTILFLIITSLNLAFAQDEATKLRNNGGKIEALKIAYLTNKLTLSPEEAQRFWPVYNKYMEEIRKTRLDARENKQQEIVTDEKILGIRKKYNTEFGKALSSEKVNTFFKAEKEFGTYLQKEIIERRQQRMERKKNGK
ncbi:hypothetical protein [Flavitalea sp.]|nr:hypothetical protein [Flavitalea sp.]